MKEVITILVATGLIYLCLLGYEYYLLQQLGSIVAP